MSTGLNQSKAKRQALLDQLSLIEPRHLAEFWRLMGWFPDLRAMATENSTIGEALRCLPTEWLNKASQTANPFGYLLDRIDPESWANYCRRIKSPWLVNVWLATGSWTLALWRLSERLHGRRDTYLELQDAAKTNQQDALDRALSFFCATVGHLEPDQRAEYLTKLPNFYHEVKRSLGENKRRQLRKVVNPGLKLSPNPGRDRPLELFLVRFWLNIRSKDPATGQIQFLPGLMFWSDPALAHIIQHIRVSGSELDQYFVGSPVARATHCYRLTAVEDTGAVTKTRQRLGLVQSGDRVHLIDSIKVQSSLISFYHGQALLFTLKTHT